MLMDREEIVADWTSLPEGVECDSLWVTLHDGLLERVQSDLEACAVTLVFYVGYVAKFNNLPDHTHFVLKLEGVSSVRAEAYCRWPAAPTVPEDATGVERRLLMVGYEPKWRRQSVDWDALEDHLLNDDVRMDVMNAELAQHGGQIGLKVEGMLLDDDDAYHSLFIHAASVSFSDTEGGVYDLNEFRVLGGRYWEAFGNRAPNVAE